MKRTIAVSLSVAFALSFAACNNQAASNEPTVTTAQVTTVTTLETTAQVSTTAQSTAETEVPMPEPFPILKEGSYDDSLDGYYLPSDFKLNGISIELIRMVDATEDVTEFDKWTKTFGDSSQIQTSLNEYTNLYSFMIRFNIPNEEMTKFLYKDRELNKKFEMTQYGFTDADIAALCTRDEKTVMLQFASSYAIISNDKVYSPQWIYTHTLKDYEKEKIPPKLIFDKLSQYRKIPHFTAEAWAALENKINAYSRMSFDFGAAVSPGTISFAIPRFEVFTDSCLEVKGIDLLSKDAPMITDWVGKVTIRENDKIELKFWGNNAFIPSNDYISDRLYGLLDWEKSAIEQGMTVRGIIWYHDYFYLVAQKDSAYFIVSLGKPEFKVSGYEDFVSADQFLQQVISFYKSGNKDVSGGVGLASE